MKTQRRRQLLLLKSYGVEVILGSMTVCLFPNLLLTGAN